MSDNKSIETESNADKPITSSANSENKPKETPKF